MSKVQVVVYSAVQQINQNILFTRDSSLAKMLLRSLLLLNLMESFPESDNPVEATLYPRYLLRSSIRGSGR